MRHGSHTIAFRAGFRRGALGMLPALIGAFVLGGFAHCRADSIEEARDDFRDLAAKGVAEAVRWNEIATQCGKYLELTIEGLEACGVLPQSGPPL